MIYVYAVTAARPGRTALGLGLTRERLRVVAHDGLAVVVGDMEARPLPDPDRLKAHDAVVRRLSRLYEALLPARFGWTAPGDTELRDALAPHRPAIAEALVLVRGCVQMNVRVLGQAQAAVAAPAVHVEDPERPGTRYLLERAEARRAAESLPELEPLRATIGPLLRAEKQERQGVAGLVGTAYHLVERARLVAYRAGVRRAQGALHPFRVHVTGPWAPYAFAPQAVS
jgi:hypothetical protein